MTQNLQNQINALKTLISSLQHDRAGLQMQVDQAAANQAHAVAGVQAQLDAANKQVADLTAQASQENADDDAAAADIGAFLLPPAVVSTVPVTIPVLSAPSVQVMTPVDLANNKG